MRVELFLTYQVPCFNCGAVGVCREPAEEKLFKHELALFTVCPYFVCQGCKYRMGPGKIMLQSLRGKSVNRYSFDCDDCGQLNLLEEEPDEYTLGDDCQFCGRLNLFI